MLIGVTAAYFLLAGQMDETTQYMSMGAILFLLALFLFIPSNKKRRNKKRVSYSTKSSSEVVESSFEEDENEIPEPVTKGVEDGASLRDRKLAKLAEQEGVDTSSEDDSDSEENVENNDDVVEVVTEESEFHTAQEYVIEADADSLEEANIEKFVSDRAERHQTIRKRIEERRRGQMAEIRASTAKMWDEQDDREDMISLLSKQGHGLNIITEPEKVSPGHPYGSVFVRIDEGSVLKVRLP